MVNKPAIEIKIFNHYFGKLRLKKQVLFDINLKISAGEIVPIAGPSGSEKTTLLTLGCGLRSPQEESLKVLGQELAGAKAKDLFLVRRNIG